MLSIVLTFVIGVVVVEEEVKTFAAALITMLGLSPAPRIAHCLDRHGQLLATTTEPKPPCKFYSNRSQFL